MCEKRVFVLPLFLACGQDFNNIPFVMESPAGHKKCIYLGGLRGNKFRPL
jgi:hypothetical protein